MDSLLYGERRNLQSSPSYRLEGFEWFCFGKACGWVYERSARVYRATQWGVENVTNTCDWPPEHAYHPKPAHIIESQVVTSSVTVELMAWSLRAQYRVRKMLHRGISIL